MTVDLAAATSAVADERLASDPTAEPITPANLRGVLDDIITAIEAIDIQGGGDATVSQNGNVFTITVSAGDTLNAAALLNLLSVGGGLEAAIDTDDSTKVKIELSGVSFTQAEKTKLAGIADNATADQTGAEIVTLLEALTGNARLNASAIRDLPQPGDGGLASVSRDATLTGNGTSGSPLGVANPFTDADETKLDGIAANAQVNRTPAQIADALEGLSGNARLLYSALRGTPSIPSTEGIQDIVGAMVSGNTETGISVTYDDANGKLNFAVSAAPTPTTVDYLFAATDGTGLSPLTDLPPGGGQSSANGEVTVAAYSGSRYWHIVRPTADGDITSVRVKGSQIEQIGAFTRGAEPFTYRGTQYRAWRSNHALTNATATTIVVR